MPSPLSILPLEASNLPRLKDLLQAEDLPTEDLQAEMSLFYAKEGEEIITCGGFELFGNMGLLRSVVIRADFQGKGLGKQWIELLLKKARELELEELYLLTTTAAGFFEKIGFRNISRDQAPQPIQSSQEFSTLCPSSAVLMHLKL